jgi:hypothetical protein
MFGMKLMFSPKFLTGAAVGSVIGMRAGREPYDKLMAKVNAGKDQMTEQARAGGAAIVDKAKDTGAEAIDKAKDAGSEVLDKVKDHTPFGSDNEQNPSEPENSGRPGRHAEPSTGASGTAAPGSQPGPRGPGADAKTLHRAGRAQ